MKNFIHKESAAGRWFTFSLAEQMANIGSEVSRASNWQGKNENYFNNAVDRAAELFYLTLSDNRWQGRRLEIGRVMAVFLDAVTGGKEYNSDLKSLVKYFDHFAYAARR